MRRSKKKPFFREIRNAGAPPPLRTWVPPPPPPPPRILYTRWYMSNFALTNNNHLRNDEIDGCNNLHFSKEMHSIRKWCRIGHLNRTHSFTDYCVIFHYHLNIRKLFLDNECISDIAAMIWKMFIHFWLDRHHGGALGEWVSLPLYWHWTCF